MSDPLEAEGLAIIGMAGRFPGADDVESFWQNLLGGVESIQSFAESELDPGIPVAQLRDPSYVRARGILEDVDLFDAVFFGISPREAELMDPQHRIFLECCWQALEDAGYPPESFPGPIGVYAGQSLNTYLLANLARDRSFLEELTAAYQVGAYPVVLGNDKDYLATRVCYKLGLHGPGVTIWH